MQATQVEREMSLPVLRVARWTLSAADLSDGVSACCTAGGPLYDTQSEGNAYVNQQLSFETVKCCGYRRYQQQYSKYPDLDFYIYLFMHSLQLSITNCCSYEDGITVAQQNSNDNLTVPFSYEQTVSDYLSRAALK